MKALSWSLLGLALGAAISSLVAGCGCAFQGDVTPLLSSTYVLVDDGGGADHSLVIATDRKSVMETWTRSGKRYEIRYEVTQEIDH